MALTGDWCRLAERRWRRLAISETGMQVRKEQWSAQIQLCTVKPKAVRMATRHNMPPPLQVDNIFVLFARWHLFRHVGYFETSADVGYLCANFSLPKTCSRAPDVRDRQTDVRQTVASESICKWGHNAGAKRRPKIFWCAPHFSLVPPTRGGTTRGVRRGGARGVLAPPPMASEKNVF